MVIRRFGLEGLVTFKRDNEYDAETYEIAVPDKNGDKVKIGVFDKVVVEIGVEKVSIDALETGFECTGS